MFAGFPSRRLPFLAPRTRTGWLWLALLSLIGGCGPKPSPPPSPTTAAASSAGQTVASRPLKLVLVGSERWAKPLDAAWGGISEQPLEIMAVAAESFAEAARDADVLLMPGRLLGDAVRGGWIRAIPQSVASQPPLSFDQLLPMVEQHVVLWDDRSFVAPLGAPLPALFCSQSAVSALPRNTEFLSWNGYAAAVRQLAGDDGQRRVAAEPLADGDAAMTLLNRATEYAGSRWLFDRQDFSPRIADECYVRGLKELCELRSFYPAARLSAVEVVQEIAAGRLLMGIGWPLNEAGLIDARLEVRSLPSGDQLLRDRWQSVDPRAPRRIWLSGHGLCVAVGANSRQSAEARALMVWLAAGEGRSILPQLTDRATVVRKAGATDDASISAATPRGPYTTFLQDQLGPRPSLPSLRLPGAQDYYDSLDRAVIAAWEGRLSPEAALAEAAEQWRAITERLGKQKQREAWLAGQGLR